MKKRLKLIVGGKANAKRPARQAERVTFEAVDVPFNYTNEQWCNLAPSLRIASRMLNEDDKGLQEKIRQLAEEGIMPDILEDLSITKDALQGLSEMCDAALARSYAVLGRLGYSPENPPPDNRLDDEQPEA